MPPRMPTTDRPEPDRPAGLPKPRGEPTDERPRRVSVPEAAQLLGISEDAVRSRLRRRTLRKEKALDGSVFVLLGDEPRDGPTTDRDRQPTDQTTDERPSAREASSPEPVEELRSRIAYLERQLDREREARREEGRELRRLLAGLIERVPELEAARKAPPDAPGAATAGAEGPGEGHPPEARTGSEGAPREPRRSWWRRLLGGP